MSGITRDANTGQGMFVNSEGRALSSAIVETFDRHENHRHGGVWSLTFQDVNPVGANDKFLYIKNTSSDKDYAVTNVRAFASTTVGKLSVKTVSGTAAFVSSTTITAASRNTSFTRTPELTSVTDTDITGLTDDGIIHLMNLSVVDTDYQMFTTSNIILGPGGALALEWEPATGEISGVISIAELERP